MHWMIAGIFILLVQIIITLTLTIAAIRLKKTFYHSGGMIRGGPGFRIGKIPSSIPLLYGTGFRVEGKPALNTRQSCRAIQQSDEMHCAMCGLRWDVNDSDPPNCRAIR